MDRGWRVVGTGASFALFGASALVLGLVAYPVLSLLPGGRATRELRMQRLISGGFRLFAGFMERVGVISVAVRQPQRLQGPGPRLVVANHPSLIDYVLLVARMPQADCVVKQASWSNPFIRGVVRGAGYIRNDTGEATVEACVQRLREGRTVLIFPEGTRSPRGQLGRFQRGAAHVQLASGIAAVPVAITCEPPGLTKGQPWYDVPARRMQYTLDVGDPIARNPGSESRALASRALTAEIREYFSKRLGLLDA